MKLLLAFLGLAFVVGLFIWRIFFMTDKHPNADLLIALWNRVEGQADTCDADKPSDCPR